jgi:predicted negative regulator of RcsB-dependent stress response
MQLRILPVIVFVVIAAAIIAVVAFRDRLGISTGSMQLPTLSNAPQAPSGPAMSIDEISKRLKGDEPDDVAEALTMLGSHPSDERSAKALSIFVQRLERELARKQLPAFEQAIKVMHQLPDSDEGVRKLKAQGLAVVARARLEQDDAGGAELDADDALKLDPKLALAHLIRGDARLAQKRQDDALAAWREGLAVAPNDSALKTRVAKHSSHK